jgi:hypothetical protein
MTDSDPELIMRATLLGSAYRRGSRGARSRGEARWSACWPIGSSRTLCSIATPRTTSERSGSGTTHTATIAACSEQEEPR